MKISVVIPAHNVAEWIAQALTSVAEQTLPADEVVVVDDRSTDDTVDRIRASGVPVKLLHSSCGNAAGTRNVGAAEATGDWIAFLDADDAWEPDHLERAMKLLEGGEEVALLSRWTRLVHHSGERSNPDPWFPSSRGGLGDPELSEVAGRPGHGFPTSGMVVRRSRFREVGGFDESQRRRHDIELFLRLAAGKRWAYQTVPSWIYREGRPGNLSGHWEECCYYAFRALLLNRERFGNSLDGLIRHHARRVLGCCSAIPDPELRSRAWRESLPFNSLPRRIYFRLVRCFPAIDRALRGRPDAAGLPAES